MSRVNAEFDAAGALVAVYASDAAVLDRKPLPGGRIVAADGDDPRIAALFAAIVSPDPAGALPKTLLNVPLDAA